jgi:NAD-dependent deacetylase
LYMEKIYQRLWQADLFISIGTSGNVYPAAGFVEEANRSGARTVELNLEPSNGENLFQQKIYGNASQIVPEFVDRLLADQC